MKPEKAIHDMINTLYIRYEEHLKSWEEATQSGNIHSARMNLRFMDTIENKLATLKWVLRDNPNIS